MAYTASQIVADALAIAKCPGFTQQGGRALNFVLDDLVLHRNLKVNLVTATINVLPNNNGPYNLEDKYLRTYSLSYLIDSTRQFLDPSSLQEYDTDNVNVGAGGYPYEYATDLSPVSSAGVGLLYIYPTANTAINMQHRYYLEQSPISFPESSSVVPWFADQDYLIQATALRMMRITDDSRYDNWVKMCENMLEIHLLTEGDEQQVVKEVKLDPRRFKVGGSAKPTKTDPF